MKEITKLLIDLKIPFEYMPGTITIGFQPYLQVHHNKGVYLVYDISKMKGKRLLRTSKEIRVLTLLRKSVSVEIF